MVGITALAYFLPDILIRNYAQKRRQAIKLELPNVLDQMLISVQAGLGFESAMARAGQNGQGPLADELIRTLQDIQVGRSRKEAYLAMAQRVDVPDLRSFVRAVVQADTYGIAIAKVLESQAKDMRVKRRQRAEEHAMKMPVKMLFPLIFFILPTLFIVVLGPTVLSIMEVFRSDAPAFSDSPHPRAASLPLSTASRRFIAIVIVAGWSLRNRAECLFHRAQHRGEGSPGIP